MHMSKPKETKKAQHTPDRLVSAASDLLEALELAAFALEGNREDDDPTLQIIRAALSKARGED
jgi:hypothetical protein